MKSLNDNPITHKAPDIFTPEIIEWLIKEGFKSSSNDSYCDKLTDDPYEGDCFYKDASIDGFSAWHIGVYIFSFGIGVDVDYNSGGNSDKRMFLFSRYTFEEAYDKMVEFVNYTKE